ncbi:release factor glutamine methyltransferase [Clostridia bacterium]|nr:release factor glutamine methyltransferase [Clostridia bacterium]
MREGYSRLRAAGSETYSLDTQLLLAHALNADRLHVLTYAGGVPEDRADLFFGYIEQRERHKPVQYITNYCEFFGLGLYVDENVLIPRADTEILVEETLKCLKKGDRALEIGAGSGAVSIALKKNADAVVHAVDVCPNALCVAQKNADTHGASICLFLSDIFSNVTDSYNIIVSNPPYIKNDEELPESVRYEPKKALYGGADGLRFYREITENAGGRLAKGGVLLFEIGASQAAEVSELLTKNNFVNIQVAQDLSGLDRVVKAQKGNTNV